MSAHAPALAPIEQIIYDVAEFSNEDPLELPPLYEFIDPDALDAFITHTTDGQIAFDYRSYRVTVTSAGEVTITDS